MTFLPVTTLITWMTFNRGYSSHRPWLINDKWSRNSHCRPGSKRCLAKSTLEDGYCSSSSVGAAAGHPAETGTRQKEILGAGTSACLVRWAKLYHSHLSSILLHCRLLNKTLTVFPFRFLSPPCKFDERSTSLDFLLIWSWSNILAASLMFRENS